MSLLGDDGKAAQGPASRVLCSLAPCMRVEEGGASWGVMALSLAMSVHWGEPEDESRSERTLFFSISVSVYLSLSLSLYSSVYLSVSYVGGHVGMCICPLGPHNRNFEHLMTPTIHQGPPGGFCSIVGISVLRTICQGGPATPQARSKVSPRKHPCFDMRA